MPKVAAETHKPFTAFAPGTGWLDLDVSDVLTVGPNLLGMLREYYQVEVDRTRPANTAASVKHQIVEDSIGEAVLNILDDWPEDIVGPFDPTGEPWAAIAVDHNDGRFYLPLRVAYMALHLWDDPKLDRFCRDWFSKALAPIVVPDIAILKRHEQRGEGINFKEFFDRYMSK